MRKVFIPLLSIYFLGACLHRNDPWTGLPIEQAQSQGTFNARGQYIIHSNDLIDIYVHNHPNLGGRFRVSTSGFITLPKLGLVRASGRNDILLQTAISLKLRPIAKNARVHVTVAEIDSYKVIISGKIKKPGLYNLKQQTTLTEALGMAGGISTEPPPERIILIRKKSPENKKVRYAIEYEKFKRAEVDLDNFLVERGDVIHLH